MLSHKNFGCCGLLPACDHYTGCFGGGRQRKVRAMLNEVDPGPSCVCYLSTGCPAFYEGCDFVQNGLLVEDSLSRRKIKGTLGDQDPKLRHSALVCTLLWLCFVLLHKW